jgi:dGTPase
VAHILATIGLGHDLGNPPFGHQGEAAIGHWFQQNLQVFSDTAGDVPEHLYPEFTAFEGNAQTLRILTRLQVSAGNVGLDLTAGTLAAIMKYSVSCDQRSSASAASKKYGYFESEHNVVLWVREQTGIRPGERHPLTWIMEAADDIAYSILDIEDAMKKGMLSPDDVFAIVSGELDDTYNFLKESIKVDFAKVSPHGRSIGEIREIKASYLRTNLIRNLIAYAVTNFEANWNAIDKRQHTRPLLDNCGLCKLLKNTAFQYVFSSTPVRCVEAEGAIALESLMTFFWSAISDREDTSELGSQRRSAAAAYGWSLISDNYRQVAIREAYLDRHGSVLPMRYRELRLLTDMVSGMTDGFARALHTNLVSAGHIRGK